MSNFIFKITCVEGIDMRDYPDFCDAYCTEADVYENNEWREATDAELDRINEDHGDQIGYVIHDEQLYL